MCVYRFSVCRELFCVCCLYYVCVICDYVCLLFSVVDRCLVCAFPVVLHCVLLLVFGSLLLFCCLFVFCMRALRVFLIVCLCCCARLACAFLVFMLCVVVSCWVR